MKRCAFILALSLFSVGCVEFDMHLREPPSRQQALVPLLTTPVSADQVTPGNARKMAQQLSVELDEEDLAQPATGNSKR